MDLESHISILERRKSEIRDKQFRVQLKTKNCPENLSGLRGFINFSVFYYLT